MNQKRSQSFILACFLCSWVVAGAMAALPETSGDGSPEPATVRTVQRVLRGKGFYAGPINGVVDPETRRALLDFQQRQGLTETGQVDRPTLVALDILQEDRSLARETGEGAVETAETVGEATLTGVTVAGKSTAHTTAAALDTTATGLETAGKGMTRAGTTTVDTASQAVDTTARGARGVTKTTSGGVRRAGEGFTDLLGVSQSDRKIRSQVLKKLDRDPTLQDRQVHVLVEDGLVRLTFTDGTPEDHDRAAAIARAVQGVKEVVVHTP